MRVVFVSILAPNFLVVERRQARYLHHAAPPKQDLALAVGGDDCGTIEDLADLEGQRMQTLRLLESRHEQRARCAEDRDV